MEKKIYRELWSWTKSILLAAAIAFIFRQFIFTPLTVYGVSMAPTFNDKDRILVTKVSKIDHFDNIVFHSPRSEDYYIKRVIGLPGDRVEMKDDVLYINNKRYSEPYLKKNKAKVPEGDKLTGNFTLKEVTGKSMVPEGYLFVMGDNRLWSTDSRRFGFISIKSVIGEVKLKLRPFKDFGMPD
ncbi:signal peptidase I [Peribacillus kribbensis]|uniref:signal peptidase I n=1 Tax=Peribacillus kribbensis TaxID=356658 RepID=UPI00041EE8C9|nr:signal peptidase I [Peribacillus kribbensis]